MHTIKNRVHIHWACAYCCCCGSSYCPKLAEGGRGWGNPLRENWDQMRAKGCYLWAIWPTSTDCEKCELKTIELRLFSLALSLSIYIWNWVESIDLLPCVSPYGGSGFRTRGPKIHRRQHERNKKHTMSSISAHDETRRVKTTRAAGKKYLRKIETFSADYDDDETIQCLPSITQMVNPCLRRQQYLASRVDFMTNFLVILLLFYVHFVSMFFLLSCSLCLLCCFFYWTFSPVWYRHWVGCFLFVYFLLLV